MKKKAWHKKDFQKKGFYAWFSCVTNSSHIHTHTHTYTHAVRTYPPPNNPNHFHQLPPSTHMPIHSTHPTHPSSLTHNPNTAYHHSQQHQHPHPHSNQHQQQRIVHTQQHPHINPSQPPPHSMQTRFGVPVLKYSQSHSYSNSNRNTSHLPQFFQPPPQRLGVPIGLSTTTGNNVYSPMTQPGYTPEYSVECSLPLQSVDEVPFEPEDMMCDDINITDDIREHSWSTHVSSKNHKINIKNNNNNNNNNNDFRKTNNLQIPLLSDSVNKNKNKNKNKNMGVLKVKNGGGLDIPITADEGDESEHITTYEITDFDVEDEMRPQKNCMSVCVLFFFVGCVFCCVFLLKQFFLCFGVFCFVYEWCVV